MEKYRSNLKLIIPFLLPAFLIYFFMAVIPIIQSLYFAFFEWPGIQGVPLKFVGFKNFANLLSYKDFLNSLVNSLQFIVLGIILQIPVGYFLAFLLSSFCKGYRIFSASFFSTTVLPITATSLIWKFIFGPNETGILNGILISLGLGNLSQAWLLEPTTALVCVIIANAWTGFGYHMTLGFAAITGLPAEILESAMLDGATGIKKIAYIIIPMIWESIKISIVLITIGSVKIFDIVFIMTEGGPNGMTHVPSTMMYYEAFKYNHYGLGSAISAVIFILSILLAVLSMKLMQREKIEY